MRHNLPFILSSSTILFSTVSVFAATLLGRNDHVSHFPSIDASKALKLPEAEIPRGEMHQSPITRDQPTENVFAQRSNSEAKQHAIASRSSQQIQPTDQLIIKNSSNTTPPKVEGLVSSDALRPNVTSVGECNSFGKQNLPTASFHTYCLNICSSFFGVNCAELPAPGGLSECSPDSDLGCASVPTCCFYARCHNSFGPIGEGFDTKWWRFHMNGLSCH